MWWQLLGSLDNSHESRLVYNLVNTIVGIHSVQQLCLLFRAKGSTTRIYSLSRKRDPIHKQVNPTLNKH